MKAILLENNGMSSPKIDEWVKSICPDFKEINSSVKEYDRSHDLWFFAMLINPELTHIFTSSAFPSQMDIVAMRSFGRIDDSMGLVEQMEVKFFQLDYFMWLIREAVIFRDSNGMKGLSIHVNYLREDFIQDLRDGEFGTETDKHLKLTLRQFEGQFSVHVYHEFKIVKSLYTEEDYTETTPTNA